MNERIIEKIIVAFLAEAARTRKPRDSPSCTRCNTGGWGLRGYGGGAAYVLAAPLAASASCSISGNSSRGVAPASCDALHLRRPIGLVSGGRSYNFRRFLRHL